eukprot:825327-Pelagomonas_calceolata.AAC.1
MGLHKVFLGAVGLNILSLGYAHVCFVGATHMSVNPLVTEHGTYIAFLASMELYMIVAWLFEKFNFHASY